MGPFLMPQQQFGKTLWKYFTASGNILFVSTNIMTLGGLYAYSTLAVCQRQGKLLGAARDEEGVGGALLLEPETGPAMSKAMPVDAEPFTRYEDPELWEHVEPETMEARFAKMSLYYLLYSYNQYKSKVDGHGSLFEFYEAWKQDIGYHFINLSRSQQFYIPKAEMLPAVLRPFCGKLQSTPMKNVRDFVKLLAQEHSSEEQQLLLYWYYDYGHCFTGFPNTDTEALYTDLVRFSSDDHALEKHLSAILTPGKRQKVIYFRSHMYSGVETASLDCMIQLLEAVMQSNAPNKNNYIIQILSLLNKYSYYSDSTKTVRVCLPTPEQQERVISSMKTDKRDKGRFCISNHPVIKGLLTQTSSV